MPEGVLVIGAANLDIKGHMLGEPVAGSSTQAAIKTSVGGVARNIAENLVRLGVPVTLLTAVGDDYAGEDILNNAVDVGIDVSRALIIENAATGTYMGAISRDGNLFFGMDDLRVLRHITRDYLRLNRDAFRECEMVALDMNLSDDAMLTAFHLAREYGKRICVDPTSVDRAIRLRQHLPLLDLITPNITEAQAILDCQPINTSADALTAARQLVSLGVGAAVITQAELGACYATPDETGQFPAVKVEIVDSTGAGDALTATVIFGMLQGIELDESLQLGLRAAALTLHSAETVVPDLSLDRLYSLGDNQNKEVDRFDVSVADYDPYDEY
ncbi:MAG: carbohydrate kinase family protein [Chloroflexi bacterium]|nr:carbohydrate kinase family protein [Chloroflexota bacterium]MCL5274964.1 carbohydrate kinase family protein [Chloroflexota bacterium]